MGTIYETLSLINQIEKEEMKKSDLLSTKCSEFYNTKMYEKRHRGIKIG